MINYFTIGDKHDFRPAFDPDGKICLYDRITKVAIAPTSYDNLIPIEYGKTYHRITWKNLSTSKYVSADNFYPTFIENGAELVIKLENVESSGYELTSASNARDEAGTGTQYMIDMDTMTITVPSVTSDIWVYGYTQATTG